MPFLSRGVVEQDPNEDNLQGVGNANEQIKPVVLMNRKQDAKQYTQGEKLQNKTGKTELKTQTITLSHVLFQTLTGRG